MELFDNHGSGLVRSPVDVIGQKDTLIPLVEGLLIEEQRIIDANEADKYDQLMIAAVRRNIIVPFWGEAARKLRKRGVGENSVGYHGFNVDIEGADTLAHSKRCQLVNVRMSGWGVLGGAHEANIRDSIITGGYTLVGSPTIINATETQVYSFVDAVNAIREGDIRGAKIAVENFDKEITPELREQLSYANEGGLFDQFGKSLAVAVHKMESMLHSLTGSTFNPRLDNSVVFSDRALMYAVGGTISNSIIGGHDALEGANIRLMNSYVVSRDGTRYYGNVYIGNPALQNLGQSYDSGQSFLTLGQKRLSAPN